MNSAQHLDQFLLELALWAGLAFICHSAAGSPAEMSTGDSLLYLAVIVGASFALGSGVMLVGGFLFRHLIAPDFGYQPEDAPENPRPPQGGSGTSQRHGAPVCAEYEEP